MSAAPGPGVPGANLRPPGRSLGRGRPAPAPDQRGPQDCILLHGGCGGGTCSRGGLTFLGRGQRGGSDVLGLGAILVLHSQGWTRLKTCDSWGSFQQLLCLSPTWPIFFPQGRCVDGGGGAASGVRQGHQQKSMCPLPSSCCTIFQNK